MSLSVQKGEPKEECTSSSGTHVWSISRMCRSGSFLSSGQRILRAIVAACRDSQSGALTMTLTSSSWILAVSFLTAVFGLTRNSST